MTDWKSIAERIAFVIWQSYEIMPCGHDRYHLMQNGDCNMCKPRQIFGEEA